jgi:CheY-like chemotaxis protein
MLRESNCVLPYWFPTTAIFVDDDAQFLANFILGLDDKLAYRTFDSAQAALRHLNDFELAPSLSQRYCSVLQDGAGSGPNDRLVRFDLSLLAQEIGNVTRFAEVSVVLVDYDMPEMDGLEFCRRIANPGIKKVLFTGVADEKIAVAAFNNGLIDRFIRKSDDRVSAIVNRTVRELQQAYFCSTSKLLQEAMRADIATYLGDPMFRGYFNALCAKQGFVESYLTLEPGGFLCLTAEGVIRRLLVYTEADMQAQWEIATDQGCPAELGDILRTRRAVPAFRTRDGFYGKECANWTSCLHEPDFVFGHQLYYVALVEDVSAADLSLPAAPSYANYLSWLDASVSA